MDYYLDSNNDSKRTWGYILREEYNEITWIAFRFVCFTHMEKLHRDPNIAKIHFMDLDDGKITVYTENKAGQLDLIEYLPYRYMNYGQRCEYALKLETIVDKTKIGVSIRTVYLKYPCFTVYKK